MSDQRPELVTAEQWQIPEFTVYRVSLGWRARYVRDPGLIIEASTWDDLALRCCAVRIGRSWQDPGDG